MGLMNTEKKWLPFNEECEQCNGDAEMYTLYSIIGDQGDRVRCTLCGYYGTIEYEKSQEAIAKQPWPWVAWHDIDECDGKCDWCKAHKHEWEE